MATQTRESTLRRPSASAPRSEATDKAPEKRRSVYDIVTEQVMRALEAGSVPWRRPWATGRPANFVTKREYRGINRVILGTRRYECRYYLTFRQAKELGGQVRTGERSSPVTFWRWIESKEKDADGQPKKIPLLRYYNVFNLEQIDGVPIPKEEVRLFVPLEAAEQIVAALPENRPPIEHGGDEAGYLPRKDLIAMPRRERFERPEDYYCTLFHELTHATGHPSRLDRKDVMSPRYGSHAYSKEELIAEMGSAYLCSEAGILNRTVDDSAAYMRNWLTALEGDSRLVIHAAAAAERATDWCLNRERSHDLASDERAAEVAEALPAGRVAEAAEIAETQVRAADSLPSSQVLSELAEQAASHGAVRVAEELRNSAQSLELRAREDGVSRSTR